MKPLWRELEFPSYDEIKIKFGDTTNEFDLSTKKGKLLRVFWQNQLHPNFKVHLSSKVQFSKYIQHWRHRRGKNDVKRHLVTWCKTTFELNNDENLTFMRENKTQQHEKSEAFKAFGDVEVHWWCILTKQLWRDKTGMFLQFLASNCYEMRVNVDVHAWSFLFTILANLQFFFLPRGGSSFF
jgi:hypothetical protein